MKKSDIESWALRIIRQVESGRPSEDSRVELKASWPLEHWKAARQLAGHANTVGGEPILWLIGVDQVNGIVGAAFEELANWIPKLNANFDGLAPRLHDVNVSAGSEQTIAALLFDTENVPFVVKNPDHGSLRGDPVSLEVPWREGTRTRSATRAELLLILSEKHALQALLGELEWNEAVASREGFGREQLRMREFRKALAADSLSSLPEHLKTLLMESYLDISNARGHQRSAESGGYVENVLGVEYNVQFARAKARQTIERTLPRFREFLRGEFMGSMGAYRRIVR